MKRATIAVLLLALVASTAFSAEVAVNLLPKELAQQPLTEVLKMAKPLEEKWKLKNPREVETQALHLKEAGFEDAAKTLMEKVKLSTIAELGMLSFADSEIKSYLRDRKSLYDFYKKDVMKERNTGELIVFNTLDVVSSGSTGELIFSNSVTWVSMETTSSGIFQSMPRRGIETIRSNPTRDHMEFVWTEVEVSQYDGIPPAEALNALRKARSLNVFDYFTVAKVTLEKEAIKDPLLLGRIEGSNVRYFIAQWDNDIDIRDIIKHKVEQQDV